MQIPDIKNSCINIATPSESGEGAVTHPVFFMVGDEYFELFTPLSRGLHDVNVFMMNSVVNNLAKKTPSCDHGQVPTKPVQNH